MYGGRRKGVAIVGCEMFSEIDKLEVDKLEVDKPVELRLIQLSETIDMYIRLHKRKSEIFLSTGFV